MSIIKAFASKRVVLENSTIPAIILVENEIIIDIINGLIDDEKVNLINKYKNIIIEDFGELVLMAGIVDSHVHLNEPGRTEWEGFKTGTIAAAAGGVTTVIDMPLNSLPPTTTLNGLELKKQSAKDNIFIDVGFWGGIIPGNIKELKPMIQAGVCGFKCFLCPSGAEEFPHVEYSDIEKAIDELDNTNSVILFHAELEENIDIDGLDTKSYDTFLKTRPSSMEINAIKMIIQLFQNSKVRCHIVHLSASDALEILKIAKEKNALLSVETCHHYLSIVAEEIPPKSTQFKCCPPIRSSNNRELLWDALKNEILDMVVSDHSPCTAELKTDDFIKSWGGISSLQFGLPLFWTEAKKRNFKLHEISKLLSKNPSKLAGLSGKKGQIKINYDADFVVWSPEDTITIKKSSLLYKNKITPYDNRTLNGKIISTILRGNFIFKDNKIIDKSIGKIIPDKKI
ncbi:hypothetical protein HCN44_007456 [Aphidius gifuensis]|uniref:allantoinase n=1 Tax=Aphidius gifuensis TaxID=684658 RepID=A0A834XQQ4_APHGI|nr:probable allantoinase 1 [Aphidius gifuensis]KAF7989146.1 hypothetical protein HCN44_007456 [Aphidius gifuensis]